MTPGCGIGMFTGEGLFRLFGKTMVDARANTGKPHVSASDNAKNVVLVNVGTEEPHMDLTLTG
ncbi:hypothetical protein [Thermoactinospora rubra]|uniref:hypothetical protein n=1 Tax=Thermoactinospora rubra TaxID=1088767 RepID=UPI00117FAB33|nr:hypothetical protein [Thermoactinospora rubra]